MRTVVDAIVANRGGPGTLIAPDAHGAAQEVSWAEIHASALRMAAALAGDGIGRGSRVGLLADTSVNTVTALQAIWLTGAAATVLPLPPGAGEREASRLTGIIADAGLCLVLLDEGRRSLEPALSAATRIGTLAELATRAESAAPAHAASVDPDDLAILQYTSGSTRSPRGVPVRHRHLAANLLALRTAMDHDAHHPYTAVSWLPLYHDMGLIGFCALPMSCGCSLVLQSPHAFVRRPVMWLDAIARHRAEVTGGPNFAYALVARLLAGGVRPDLSSLRLAISGGEPIDARTMTELAANGASAGLDPAALTPAYGLAESTLAVTMARPGTGTGTDPVDRRVLETEGKAVAGEHAMVRVGFPLEGTTIRITHRVTGRPLETRQVGLIEVAGPSVVGHYWGEPQPADPWLRTGDLGYLAEGELVVCGRQKDILFAAGRNIYPQDIEAAVDAVPGVRRGGIAAFGVPGALGDQLVVAVESTSTDKSKLHADVISAVQREIGLTPAAILVLRPGRLPKTTSGKLRRSAARAGYLSGTLTSASGKRSTS